MRKLIINSRIKLSVALLTIASLAVSCSDFLDTPPEDVFSDENFWTSENNVKTFSWLNYNTFNGYGNNTGITADFYFHASATGLIDDNLAMNTFINFPTTANATNANWNEYYTLIRRCNLMLERVPNTPMDQVKKNHYIGVAKFFRAHTYFRLAQQFGNVPYTDMYLAQSDINVYKPALERAEVINNVIKDLEEAIPMLLNIDDSNVTVNKYTAYALLSRVCLSEGTYRKYNLSQNGDTYLQKAKEASLAVMNNNSFKLNADWKSLYNSVELLGNTEVILTKRYIRGVLGNSVQSYTNTSTTQNGLTKFAAESYVTTNGLPIKQAGNDQYLGDNNIANTFANRDPRFAKAFSTAEYAYSDKPTGNGLSSITGYVIQLYNNPNTTGTEVTTGGQNQIDAPIFTLSEVYLNYAEACAELGTVTNADLNLSINKVRTRAGIATLTTDGTNATVGGVQINDPQRTSALELISGVVNPIIWEIRRERRIEFMSWTTMRKEDLMRWKKGDYLDTNANPDVALGAKITDLIGSGSKTKVNAEGYVIPYATGVSRVFVSPKNYFSAIPTNDISLYAAEGIELKQNPGW
ncbi:RagB/SusD family nutrient uptake outer membrane protein [Flavobacterium sp. GA093]|uniref:RagB/SusD family nutrient uptake outer membrane protein n=1 Tax=Flavobacterium hydrocarbonoxydans TaxID=2683249 RepID=A0A6I4NMW3_9FLAO|nr:RagB/SusD family nutrient uptake outer membrane protein [Flavobacterium hydrocarbonoxydans]MWB95443.1 RagB/SusD family nutrient uptake outer membrane protein [Flavobacterium hydrocarbonoxydans]